MGKMAVMQKIYHLTELINDLSHQCKYIDKTTIQEKEYRLQREAYRRVWEGRRLDEINLPFDPKERATFVEAFTFATDILYH